MTALELKPCPFCGGGAKLSNGFVSCEVCVCAMPLGFGFDGEAVGFDDDGAAITKWNRRADLASVQPAQVRVKPLVWEWKSITQAHRADAPIGGEVYLIWKMGDGWVLSTRDGDRPHLTLENAKTAAQADHEARTLAALAAVHPGRGDYFEGLEEGIKIGRGEPQPISKSADLHDPRDEVIRGLVNALVTVNGITEASYPQVTSAGDVAEIQKVARAALAAAKAVQHG